MSGRPRTPTNVLYLNGSAKKNPDRMKKRAEEPKDERDIGVKAHGRLKTKLERECYKELVDNCIPSVLKQCDSTAVMVAAKLLARFVDDDATSAETAQLIKLLGQFGMTPSERTRLKVTNEKPSNPFDED